MKPSRFPDPSETGPEGIIAIGGPLDTESLIDAYSNGIFPWPIEGYPLTWFCPEERGVLFFRDFQVSKRNQKYFEKQNFQITFNKSFEEVIEACAEVPRPEGRGTWITSDMKAAYITLHREGYAHSVETRNLKGELLGGLYGMAVAGIFSAESMFYRESNASQFALAKLVKHLQSQGAEFMDIQMVTDHLEKMGGTHLPRDEYIELMRKTQKKKLSLF